MKNKSWLFILGMVMAGLLTVACDNGNSSIIPIVTLTPTITINDANLTVTVSVGGTATGAVTLNTTALPAAVTASISGTKITVTGIRPTTKVPPITGSFIVGVTREGVTQDLTVEVNLTTTWVSLFEMVSIPAGTFTMGSPDATNPPAEKGRYTNETQWQVILSSFYMGAFQVTQEQWAVVMEGNTNDINTTPSNFHGGSGLEPAAGEVQAKRPVEQVSWYDVLVFCNRLSTIEGLNPAYKISGSTNPNDWGTAPTSDNAEWDAVEIVAGSTGYRLPTEAQWEYACRAGTMTAFNNGEQDWENQVTLYPIDWFDFNSSNMTHEVGRKTANAWGLYDMHGNVHEWCWDWYAAVYPSGTQTDPQGASSGTYRVLRSGSWYVPAQLGRSASRSYTFPSDLGGNLGFRLVRPGAAH